MLGEGIWNSSLNSFNLAFLRYVSEKVTFLTPLSLWGPPYIISGPYIVGVSHYSQWNVSIGSYEDGKKRELELF